jgi:hypothetical protein
MFTVPAEHPIGQDSRPCEPQPGLLTRLLRSGRSRGDNNWQANIFGTVNQRCVDPVATIPPPTIPFAVGPLTGRSDTVDDANRGTVSSNIS